MLESTAPPKLRRRVAKPPPHDGVPLLEDATHAQIARYIIVQKHLDSGAAPAGAEGQLWTPNAAGLFEPQSVDQLAVEIGDTFHKLKRSTKVSDYRAIAQHTIAAADDPEHFSGAPRGVVTPEGFYTVDASRVVRTDLRPTHRQRFAIDIAPDFNAEPAQFTRFLAQAFADDDCEAQIGLAAEMVGAALFGLAAALQLAFLLFGPGGGGKSTFLAIVRALFPTQFVAAISPMRWGHEYYIANLAGKRVNIVGELPDDPPLPSAAFKNVTGGDPIEARHPTHRPFYFINEAAHFFSSNHPLATVDRTEGFYRRWRVLRFGHAVPIDERDPDLAQRIVTTELGGVLAWAMRGAERVAGRHRLATTRAHDEVMQRWRIGGNPVLLFFTDSDFVELDAEHCERSSEVYATFRRWAQEHGNRPMSAQAFMQLLDDSAGGLGVHRTRKSGSREIRGLRLVGSSGGLL